MNLTDLIKSDFAKRPHGFRASDLPGAERANTSAIYRALKRGTLFAARISYRHVIYFGTLVAAVDAEARAKATPPTYDTLWKRAKKFKTMPVAPAPDVEIQRIPGFERFCDQPVRVLGGFASAGIGKYPLPASSWVPAQ